MGNLNCVISQKWLIVERNGRKIWDSGYYSAHMYGTFYARYLEFALGSFGAFCKISESTIFETLLLQHFSLDFNQTSYKVS